MDKVSETDTTQYAGIFSRLVAYFIDCLLLFLALIGGQAIIYFLGLNPIVGIFNSGRQPSTWQLHLWVFLSTSVPFLIYFATMISSSRQATLGMRLMNIRVSGPDKKRINFGRALFRSAIMLIPFELNHAVMFHLADFKSSPTLIYWLASIGVWILMFIYLVSVLVTKHSQSIHDLWALTTVEKTVVR